MPETLDIITPEPIENKNIFDKKEYNIKINKKPYIFIISRDSDFIYFTIIDEKNLSFFQPKAKYDLQNILEILKLDFNSYRNLNKIIELLDKAYLNNKFLINQNKDDNTFNINIKLNIGNGDYDSKLTLKNEELDNNEKFEIIIRNLNLIKEDNNLIDFKKKIDVIDDMMNRLRYFNNKRINENENLINSLREKIKDNEKKLKSNEEIIITLKEEISNLKNIISNIKNTFKEYQKEKLKEKENNKEIVIINDNKLNIKKNYNIINKKPNFEEEKNCEENYINNQKELNYKIEKLMGLMSFNIMMVGGTSAGKTSIFEKYFSKPFSNSIHSFPYTKITYLKLKEKIISIKITDPPGNIKYKNQVINFCKNQDLIVFVYNINKRKENSYDSFNYVKELIREVKRKCNKNTHYALIGSFSELNNERELSIKEGEELVKKENMDFFMEVSAYTGYNIDNMIFEVAKHLYQSRYR